ncbi:hypothetical protein H9L39_17112 [Fusarium oxysporum f. sp. albedinis]|nr:hypothetical protein H9L39_17112 [Fusarium oxysporum f. sp. albedinis]
MTIHFVSLVVDVDLVTVVLSWLFICWVSGQMSSWKTTPAALVFHRPVPYAIVSYSRVDAGHLM